jgi:hypothetical protein
MFFLGFPVYRFEQNSSVSTNYSVNSCVRFGVLSISLTNSIYFQAATAKDPDSAFFKRLDGFQPCEVNELQGGTHYFSVYGKLFYIAQILAIQCNIQSLENPSFLGDNFFKSASYTIEVVCAEPFSAEKERLRTVESKILAKRSELSKFESEYREVCLHPISIFLLGSQFACTNFKHSI